MRNGMTKLPAPVPDKQNALAMPRFLSKYLAVNMTPGVVDNPMPTPVRTPKVTKRTWMDGANPLRMMPVAQRMEPKKVTRRQLYFWQRALVMGAVANANGVIEPGIQEANETVASG